jgi:hypothetical protein
MLFSAGHGCAVCTWTGDSPLPHPNQPIAAPPPPGPTLCPHFPRMAEYPYCSLVFERPRKKHFLHMYICIDAPPMPLFLLLWL